MPRAFSGVPMSLIAVMLSPNVDARIVETLVNYRYPDLGSRSAVRGEAELDGEKEPRTRLKVLREHECSWWTQEEWAAKGGEEAFWKRLEGHPS